MIRLNKVFIFGLILTPLFTHAFLEFCFPISFVILTYAFAWPGAVFYGLFGIQNMYLGVILGVIINISIVYYIGKYLDSKNGNVSSYRHKLLKIFGIICIVLVGFVFIDPSCWS